MSIQENGQRLWRSSVAAGWKIVRCAERAMSQYYHWWQQGSKFNLYSNHLNTKHLWLFGHFLSCFQMVWFRDLADHLNSGHFRLLNRHFLSSFQTTNWNRTIGMSDLSGIQMFTVHWEFIWILDSMGVWYSNGKVKWLGGPFKYRTFGTINRLFSVWFSDHHSNTGPFDCQAQIYHFCTRLVRHSEGYFNGLDWYLNGGDLPAFQMVLLYKCSVFVSSL